MCRSSKSCLWKLAAYGQKMVFNQHVPHHVSGMHGEELTPGIDSHVESWHSTLSQTAQ